MSEVADIIDRAADALWMYGRTRGRGLGLDGQSMCVLGALVYAEGGDPQHVMGRACVARTALQDYLAVHPELHDNHERFLDCHKAAWVWNDSTHDDELVIDTLRRCAKELREEAS